MLLQGELTGSNGISVIGRFRCLVMQDVRPLTEPGRVNSTDPVTAGGGNIGTASSSGPDGAGSSGPIGAPSRRSTYRYARADFPARSNVDGGKSWQGDLDGRQLRQ